MSDKKSSAARKGSATKRRAKEDTNAEVWDLVSVQERLEKMADRVIEFTNDIEPNFICDAVINAIDEAAERVGFPAPTWERGENTRKILADLFSQTHNLSLRPKSSSEEIAGHLSAILAHADTPQYLSSKIMDFLNNESSQLWAELMQKKETIQQILERGGCGYVLCPGTKGKGVCPGPPDHTKGRRK